MQYNLPNPIGTIDKIVSIVFLDLFIKLKIYDINKEFMPKSNSNNIIIAKKKQQQQYYEIQFLAHVIILNIVLSYIFLSCSIIVYPR